MNTLTYFAEEFRASPTVPQLIIQWNYDVRFNAFLLMKHLLESQTPTILSLINLTILHCTSTNSTDVTQFYLYSIFIHSIIRWTTRRTYVVNRYEFHTVVVVVVAAVEIVFQSHAHFELILSLASDQFSGIDLPALLEDGEKSIQNFQWIALHILNFSVEREWIKIKLNSNRIGQTFWSNNDRPSRRNSTPADRFHVDTHSLQIDEKRQLWSEIEQRTKWLVCVLTIVAWFLCRMFDVRQIIVPPFVGHRSATLRIRDFRVGFCRIPPVNGCQMRWIICMRWAVAMKQT